MTMVIVGMGKKMLGRLRPHFMNVCKPDMSKVNCSDGYITNYVCTGTDVKALYEMRYVKLEGLICKTFVIIWSYFVLFKTFESYMLLATLCKFWEYHCYSTHTQ